MTETSPTASAPPSASARRVWPGRLCRWGSLLVFSLLALPVFASWAARLFATAASPWVMICTATATRAVTIATLMGLPVFLWVIVRQRAFCRYFCPTGLLIDCAGKLCPLRRYKTQSNEDDEPVEAGPQSATRVSISLGQWFALITLGGALLGWPILLWLDPLAVFSGFFGMFRRPATAVAVVAATALPVVLIASVFRPRLWCGKLCPLGGMQDIVANLRRTLRGRSSPAGRSMARKRRWILALGAGCVGAVAIRKFVPERAKVLRPPGAAGEPAFTELCIRCGSCVRACPVNILHPDPGLQGVAGLLAPLLRIEEKYCKEDCCRCGEVCPSGAIRRLTLAQKPQARIGLPMLDKELCLRNDERECSACVPACPYEAVELAWDAKEYKSFPRVAAGKCNGCGACQIACPASPTKALVVGVAAKGI